MRTFIIGLFCNFYFFAAQSQSIPEIRTLIDREYFVAATQMCKKLASNNPEASYWLVQISIAQNKNEEAKTQLSEFLKFNPNSKLLQIADAQLLLSDGKTKEAQSKFESIIKNSGKNKIEVLIAVGRAYATTPMQNINYDFAIATLQEAQVLQPNNGLISIYLGDCYRRILEGGKALLAYKKAMEIDANIGALAYYKIGLQFQSMKNCDVLNENYLAAVKADSHFAPAWLHLYTVSATLDGGCYDKQKSETYYKAYLANAEPGIQTQLLQINHLYLIADYVAVIAKIKEVQTTMPTEAPNRLRSIAAAVYFAQKDYPNTIQSIENYIASLGKEDEIITFHYKTLAVSYSETGNYAKAVKAYLDCAEIQKDTFIKMGYIDNAAAEAIKAKDYATACVLYSNVFDAKKSPGASDYYKLGSAYYNAGNCEESKRIFSVYADKFPNDWRPPLYLGYCEAKIDPYMSMGNAIPYYNKFIELAKNETTAKKSLIHTHMYLFAYEYQIKKNTAAAIAHLESVLALDPANEDALKYKTLLVK